MPSAQNKASRLRFEGRAQMGAFGASLVLARYPQGLLHHAATAAPAKVNENG